MIKDRIFTEEELLKVTELATNYNNEEVANYFAMSGSWFSKLKYDNKELSAAFTKGVNARIKGKQVGRKKHREIPPKRERNASYQELSPQEALEKFQEKVARDKERRLQKELRELNL
jgi:hypothetical protein